MTTTHIMGDAVDEDPGYPGICGHKYDPNCRETLWAVEYTPQHVDINWCPRCVELAPLVELAYTEL